MNAFKRIMTSGGAARIRVVAGVGLLVVAGSGDRAHISISPAACRPTMRRWTRTSRRSAPRLAGISPRSWSGTTGRQGRAGAGAHRSAGLPGAGRPGVRAALGCRKPGARRGCRRAADERDTRSVTSARARSWRRPRLNHARSVADYDRASSRTRGRDRRRGIRSGPTAERARADLERMAPLAARTRSRGCSSTRTRRRSGWRQRAEGGGAEARQRP